MLTAIEQAFDFCPNALTGPVATELGQLTGLTEDFQLCMNSFSSAIPTQVTKTPLCSPTRDRRFITSVSPPCDFAF